MLGPWLWSCIVSEARVCVWGADEFGDKTARTQLMGFNWKSIPSIWTKEIHTVQYRTYYIHRPYLSLCLYGFIGEPVRRAAAMLVLSSLRDVGEGINGVTQTVPVIIVGRAVERLSLSSQTLYLLVYTWRWHSSPPPAGLDDQNDWGTRLQPQKDLGYRRPSSVTHRVTAAYIIGLSLMAKSLISSNWCLNVCLLVIVNVLKTFPFFF